MRNDISGEPILAAASINSNLKALRFKFTVKIETSAENDLDLVSVAMLFRMTLIDKSRITKKYGRLSAEDLEKVKHAARQMPGTS